MTYPNLEVCGPDGSRLCTASGAYVAAANCLLDSTGTHTVLIMGRTGSNAGPFGLYLQRINAPVDGTPISYGGNYSGALDSGAV